MLITAYESDDGLTCEFFTIDADGTIMIQDFSFNTWYSFTVVFTGDGTSLGDAGSTLKYLGFFDADGLCNWQGYVDDITATWY